MKLLDRMSFARKVLLLPLIATVVFVGIFIFYGLPQFRHALIDTRVESNRNLVETAHSLVDAVREDAIANGLSEAETKERAMAMLRRLSYGESNYFWVNDLQGKMILHPALPELEGRNIAEAPFNTDFLEELLAKARKNGEGYVQYRWPRPGNDQPVDKISFVSLYKPWGWVIATGLYVDDVDARIIAFGEQAVLGLILAVILLFITSHLLASRIARPLHEAETALEKLARGKVDVDVSYEGHDEAGRMMAAMREMIAAHQALSEHANRLANGDLSVVMPPRSSDDVLGAALAELAESLRKQLGEIVHTMEVISRTATSLGGSVQMLASSTHETATSISETTASVTEVKTATRLGCDNAGALAESAKATLDTSRKGLEATRQNRAGMDRILEQINEAGSQVEALAEKAGMVEQITTFVADLSDRSQILAVNAAIEAAKAGEAGAGFEEVAREMRRLAVESKDATTHTRRILMDIRDSVQETATTARESTEVVQTASEQLSRAEQAITDLADQLGKAAQASSEIAATQQQEYTGVAQIGEAMESIRAASDQSAEVSEKLASESKSLDELNSRLERILNRYKF